MENDRKTKNELIAELESIYKRVNELEKQVGEHKTGDAERATAQQRYQELFDNVVIGLLRSTPGPDGTFTDVNPAMVKMMEADDREQLMALHPSEIYLDPSQRRIVSDVLMSKGFIKGEEVRFKTLKGRPIWCRISAVKKIDANGQISFDNTIEDITEHKLAEEASKQAEEALRASEERHRTTLYSIGDAVITTDTESRVQQMNPVAARLTGWSEAEAFGKPLSEVFHVVNEETRAEVENPVARVLREGAVVGLANHSALIAKDGTEHPIADSGAPIRDENGAISGVVLMFRDQTNERMAQKALQESERKFRETVTHLDEGYYSCMMDGVLLEHNQAFNRILGFEIERDLKGEKLPDFWQNPDERNVYLQELMTRGSIMNYLINAKTIRGEKVVVMANSHLVKDEKGGLVRIEGTFSDFTERKRMEEELLKLNAQLEQRVFARTQELQVASEELQRHREEQQIILDSVPAWIFYKDRENRFIRVNQAFADVMGMAKEQLEGKALIDLYPKDQADAFRKDDEKVIESGQPKRNIIESMDSPEGKLWVQTDKLPYRDIHGNIIGIIGFTLDITERKKLEDSLRDQAVKTEALNKELEAFSYSVSHDLRAPLRHVSGYVELLNKRFQSDLPEKGRHYLDSIADSVHQMGTLIDNLLQFSRTGRAEIRLTELDMNGTVQEVVESVKKDNPDRKIEWVVGQLPSVYGDDATLRLVWNNLLSNAVKFTRTRERALIEIGSRVESNEVVYFVRDNGVGFDMKYAQKLFGVFQRLHPTEEFEGTGIGLANVRRIILRHGGRTWAEAESNKGATFYFSIPKP